MFRNLLLASLLVSVAAVAVGQEKKDAKDAKDTKDADSFKSGTKWTGTYFMTSVVNGKKQAEGYELEIEITKRDGKDFTAEFWKNKRKEGYVVEGTVDKGKVEFKFVKGLANAGVTVIGNSTFVGRVDKGALTGMVYKLKTNPAYRGEVKVKLKEE